MSVLSTPHDEIIFTPYLIELNKDITSSIDFLKNCGIQELINFINP